MILLNGGGMKTHFWKLAVEAKLPPPRVPRRRSVAAILRAAYRRFASDAVTQRAVRRCLPSTAGEGIKSGSRMIFSTPS